jgi:CRISPR-associated protein Csd1
MSWIQKLSETYDRCVGHEPDGVEPLMPISHTTQQVQIEIVLDGSGAFRRASVLDKSTSRTIVPCTEGSAGRSGKKPVNHPLCDKLQYVARDYLQYGGEVTSGFAGKLGEPYEAFLATVKAWANSDSGHPKVTAILSYIEQGRVVSDLVAAGVLPVNDQGQLLKKWTGDKGSTPSIFKVIQNTQAPEDAFVRWQVEEMENPISATWQDPALISAWVDYYQHIQTKRGFCMVTGDEATLAEQHPDKLRHGGDMAKLISSNDTSGYTFMGRFLDADQAAAVGFDVTQKAHSMLQWLIRHQAYHDKSSGQVFVAWSCNGAPVPDLFASTLRLLEIAPATPTDNHNSTDTAQTFALRLRNAIAGYGTKLDPTDDIVVLGLDSATKGRMAITYYRELKASEFLDRIESWHTKCSWAQDFERDRNFVGAPAPRDIAEAAFGNNKNELEGESGGKLAKMTVERLLPCIVDSQPIPRDLVQSACRRAGNRLGFARNIKKRDEQRWNKCLGIACALYKGHRPERSYQMSLEHNRTTRDYLYGRLLAIAEHVEGRALYVAGESRDTTAARLMQRFADRPYSTWRTIEVSLTPYKTRLRAKRAGFLRQKDKLLDDVTALFASADFTDDSALSGEFLLGYHCQRQELWKDPDDKE